MDEEHRDLGGLGQSEFESLCNDYPGAVANKANNDRRGWDYIVEFPYPSHKLPLDMKPSPPVAVVQVKATEGEPVVQVKLSNAMRFASRPDPCFYVLFVFEPGNRKPKAMYVRHVWDDLIEHAILRSRELEVDERIDHHKATVTIRFKDEHRINDSDVMSVLHRIASEQGTEYAKEKAKQLYFSGVGEEGFGQLGLRFPEGVTEEDLIDLSLGIRKSVPCDGTVAYSERFGIRLRAPMFDVGPGHLSVDTSSPTSSTIVFSGLPGGDIACPVGVLAPQFSLQNESNRRIRVRGVFLDLVFKLSDLTAIDTTLALPVDRQASLDELEQYLRLVCEAAGKEIAFQLWIDSKPALWGNLRLPADPEGVRNRQSILPFVQLLQRYMPRATVPEGFGFSQTEIIDHGEAILAFLRLTLEEKIIATSGAPQEVRFSEGDRASVFYSAAVPVGQYVICAQMVRLGEFGSAGVESIKLTMSKPKILAALAFEGTIGPTELKQILQLDMRNRGEVVEKPYENIEDAVILDGLFSSTPSTSTYRIDANDTSVRSS
ncbi:hypothetical protein [Roseibium sp.]|uniref:hypothetical protein n=1 Tax=Roseibium sp. TaxID=1936156 RepID=UPI003BAEF553